MKISEAEKRRVPYRRLCWGVKTNCITFKNEIIIFKVPLKL